MKKIFYIFMLFVFSAGVINSQWIEQSSGQTTQLASISAIDDNNAWICGYVGKVLRTTNGGVNWTLVTSPAAADFYNIFAIDANTALTTSSPGGATGTNVYRTTNGGSTWTLVFNQPTAAAFIDAIWFTSASNGFMMGDPVSSRWSLWKTTNGGVNWDSTGLYLPVTGAEAGWNNGMFVSGSNIWFNTNQPRIYYSTNGGTSFAAQTIAGSGSFGTIWFNSLTSGVASYGTFLIGTTNSGTLWTPLALTGTGNINGITGSGSTFFVCRSSLIISKSINGGTTWATDYTSPAGNYTHMQKALNGNRIWACRINGGISKTDQLIGITPISGEVPGSYSLSQNYPNPFNPVTKIEFAIPNSSNVSLKVYNTLGKEVSTVYSGYLSAGRYSADFNASEFSSGVYFYVLSAGNYTETKKMTLVK